MRTAGPISLALALLACTPRVAEPELRPARATLARGAEAELGELSGHDEDAADPTDARVACGGGRRMVALSLNAWPGSELLALPVTEDGARLGPERSVLTKRLTRHVYDIAVAGDADGFAIALAMRDEDQSVLEVARLDPDGRVVGRVRVDSHPSDDGSHAIRGLRATAGEWVLEWQSLGVRETRLARLDGALLSQVDVPFWLGPVECGGDRCIASIALDLGATSTVRVFDRNASILSSVEWPVSGQPAACGRGLAVLDGTMVRVLDREGLPVGTIDVSSLRAARLYSGTDRVLLVGHDGIELVGAEIDPAAPPASLVAFPLSSPSWPFGIASGPTGWLTVAMEPEGHGTEGYQNLIRRHFRRGTLELDARSTEPTGLAAPYHQQPRVVPLDDGWIVAWEQHTTTGEERQIARIDRDARVLARATIGGGAWHDVAVAGEVVAFVATEWDPTTGTSSSSLHRLARVDLAAIGAAEPLPSSAGVPRVAFDGEQFVAGNGPRALARYPILPGAPPVALASSPLAPSTAWRWELLEYSQGVLVITMEGEESWLADSRFRVGRWDRALGWRDGSGLSRAGARLRAAASLDDEAAIAFFGAAGARLVRVTLDAEVLSFGPESALGEGEARAIASRGDGWLAMMERGPEVTPALVGRTIERDLSVAEAWPIQELEPLDGTAYHTGLSCLAEGRCLAVYTRYVAEAPFRNRRLRAHVLFASPNGTSCERDDECASLYCVDGICCEDACGGDSPLDCLVCGAGGLCNIVGEATSCGADACGTCSLGHCETASCATDAGASTELDAAIALDAGLVADAGARVDAASDVDAASARDGAVGFDGGASPPTGSGCSCRVEPRRNASGLLTWIVMSLVLAVRARTCRRGIVL